MDEDKWILQFLSKWKSPLLTSQIKINSPTKINKFNEALQLINSMTYHEAIKAHINEKPQVIY